MIVKIQKPLATNEILPQALIYNKNRNVTLFLPFEQVQKLFREGELKVYHNAHINDAGELVIEERVRDQDW